MEHFNNLNSRMVRNTEIIPVIGMNFWHVFTMKLSDRSDSSSSPENSCHYVNTTVSVSWPLLNILKLFNETLCDCLEEPFQHPKKWKQDFAFSTKGNFTGNKKFMSSPVS